MPPYINDLNINISLQTQPLAQQGFGMPLSLGHRTAPSGLIGDYGEFSDPASMVAAGFTVDDPEYKMAALMFAQSPCPEKIAVYVRDAEDSISASLAELVESHNDWYALLITERAKADLQEAGTWAMANEKIFFGCTTDVTALDGRNNIREAYLIHSDAASFPEAAWVGLCLPQDIGSITWKWKRPTGVIASTFDLTTLAAIRAGKGQTMSSRSGVVYTDEGITTGGEYIDIIQSRDYLKARLGEELFNLQVKSGKVPFDNTGFARVEAVIRSVFKQAGKQGIIARVVDEADKEYSDEGVYMYTLSVPRRADIPANDRAARKLTGVSFQLVIAGAVHNIAVSGVITV